MKRSSTAVTPRRFNKQAGLKDAARSAQAKKKQFAEYQAKRKKVKVDED